MSSCFTNILLHNAILSNLAFGKYVTWSYAVLIGHRAYLVRRLQSVLNATARLIYHMTSADHITDALGSLHWLRVPERIKYKVAVH